jgi:hypothetical protein
MPDREKVLTWLEICGKDRDCSGTCPYSEHGFGEYGECREQLMEDAFDLLKEDCHNCKLECLLQKYDELKEKYDALLKEQETGHWIYLENCSNSGVYCSECNTKVFDNYPFKKKFSYFCPHCGTRMEGEIERR